MQTEQLRRILVAVANPNVRANKAVKRAAEIARKTGASIELFNAIRFRTIPFGGAGIEAAQVTRAAIEQNRAALDRTARPLRREEIIVATTVATAEVLHEAILEQAKRTDADLIVIEGHKHGTLARAFLRQTDFELIRRSPIPILIVKGATAWRAPRVLAALDPFHSHDKPRGLDTQIVNAARTMANAFGGAVHVGHVYWPLAELFPNVVMEPAVMTVTPREQRSYEATLKRKFFAAVDRYGVPAKRRHLRRGDPGTQLPLLARDLRARLIVMGAVSRSGVKQWFIGSTAERVLDSMQCDVLIVKAARR